MCGIAFRSNCEPKMNRLENIKHHIGCYLIVALLFVCSRVCQSVAAVAKAVWMLPMFAGHGFDHAAKLRICRFVFGHSMSAAEFPSIEFRLTGFNRCVLPGNQMHSFRLVTIGVTRWLNRPDHAVRYGTQLPMAYLA